MLAAAKVAIPKLLFSRADEKEEAHTAQV